MKNRKPKINKKLDICVVCEGSEEFEYLSKLKKLSIFNDKKYSITLCNAKGITNIINVYSYKFQSGSYCAVLIFCDTDDHPFTQYKELKKKLQEFHGKNKFLDLPEIIYFGNPCTMQIILSHFGDVKLKTRTKSKNAQLIKMLTSVDSYQATDKQIMSVMQKLTVENYKEMLLRLNNLSKVDNSVPSSNFYNMVDKLTNNSDKWIIEFNNKL